MRILALSEIAASLPLVMLNLENGFAPWMAEIPPKHPLFGLNASGVYQLLRPLLRRDVTSLLKPFLLNWFEKVSAGVIVVRSQDTTSDVFKQLLGFLSDLSKISGVGIEDRLPWFTPDYHNSHEVRLRVLNLLNELKEAREKLLVATGNRYLLPLDSMPIRKFVVLPSLLFSKEFITSVHPFLADVVHGYKLEPLHSLFSLELECLSQLSQEELSGRLALPRHEVISLHPGQLDPIQMSLAFSREERMGVERSKEMKRPRSGLEGTHYMPVGCYPAAISEGFLLYSRFIRAGEVSSLSQRLTDEGMPGKDYWLRVSREKDLSLRSMIVFFLDEQRKMDYSPLFLACRLALFSYYFATNCGGEERPRFGQTPKKGHRIFDLAAFMLNYRSACLEAALLTKVLFDEAARNQKFDARMTLVYGIQYGSEGHMGAHVWLRLMVGNDGGGAAASPETYLIDPIQRVCAPCKPSA